MLEKTSVLVCVGLCSTLSIAHADTEPDPGTAPSAASTSSAGEEGTTQMVLPKGRLVLDVFVPINLSKDNAFKPVSISPDLWYGVTDDVTVGLVHSGVGITGFMGDVGTALCLTGKDNGCAKVYDNVGLEGRYKLKNGPLAYAVTAGIEALALDPDVLLDLKVGLAGRWQKDKLSVEFAPSVAIAVTKRSVDVAGTSVTLNHDILLIPVTGLYTVAPKIAVSVQTGLFLPLEDAGDLYRVPLSIGGHYSVNESLEATLAFSLPALITGGDGGGADARSLTLGGTYAF